ncbi:MAG TPA: hypothetical protein VEA99_13945 [Gemmatimonadaceae bacterium]|nr:hypothetical protein [Gemmatimonadaceae bacterium]
MMRTLIIGLAAALLVGCDCTDAGCFDGLFVELGGSAPSALRVEAYTSDPLGPRFVYECADRTRCATDGAFFEAFFPERVWLRVTADGRTATYERRPEYRRERPNGAGCDPVCRNAEVTVPSP